MLTLRFTLSRKVTFLLGCLGILLLLVALGAFIKLTRIEGVYGRLLEDDVRALLIIPRMNVTLHDLARVAGQRTNPLMDEDRARLGGDMASAHARLRQEIAALRSVAPEYSRAAAEIETAVAALAATGQRAAEAVQLRQPDRARAVMRSEFAARFDRLRAYLQALGEQIRRDMLAQARAREQDSTRIIRRTLAASVLTLAAGLLLAQLWVWHSLARPLQALVTAVRRLVAGDTNLEIPGGERTDEVGLLASALGIFRQNLVRKQELEEDEHASLERLKRSEAGFRSLIEAAPDAWIITDNEQRIVGVNRRAEQMFGWSRSEMVGQLTALLVPQRFRDEQHESHRRLRELSQRLPGATIELLALRKSGDEFPAEMAIAPIETPEGGQLFCASIRDVSERRKTETELADKVAFQRALIDSVPYPVFIKNAEGRFVGCNRAYEQAFGTTARNMRGKTVLDLDYIPPADRERFHAEDLEAIRRVTRRSYELPIDFADGRTHVTLYSVDAFCLADGRPGGLIGVLVDITDRKAAEEELRRSKSLLQSVTDNAAAYIFVKDLAGRYLLVNQPYVDLLNRPREKLIGWTTADVFSADLAAAFSAVEAEIVRTGQPHVGESVFALGGKTHCFLAHRFPLFDETGKMFGIGGVSTDITDIKRAQQDLAEARDAAESANRAKSAFVAMMSHEIRTPMNAIINLTALALESNLTPRQRQYVSVAHSSARGLLALLNDILDFSKIEAGRLELELAPFVLRPLLEEVADSFRGRVLETRIDFGVLVADDVPDSLVGDTLRLRQILINLLGNAFKFTERGEIVVRVSKVSAPSPEAESPAHVWLRFSVRDTGIGIPQEKLGRLFEAFSQADSSTSRRFGGTGLGLAISRRLVQLMHGQLGVESEPGRGSEFTFTAQFELGPAPAAKSASPPLPHDLQHTKALVIEDSEVSRELLLTMLRRFGLEAEGVATAEAGLQRLGQAPSDHTYGLVILDWLLPDLNGVEVARRIRALPAVQRLPIVMVSAYAGEKEERAAHEAGINAFLPKPITGSLLLDAITRATGLRPEISHAPATQRPSSSQFAGRRILVAEDNEANQFVVREILERAGATVEIANSGLEALERVHATPYDLVLMDMQMPGMDGLEATRRIRAELPALGLPIVALTANAMRSDVDACLEAGMNDYVAKPIERTSLFATLTRWIGSPPTPATSPPVAPETVPAGETAPPGTSEPATSPAPGETGPSPSAQTHEPSVAPPANADAPNATVDSPARRRSPRRKRDVSDDAQLDLIPPAKAGVKEVLPQPGPEDQLPGIDLLDATQRLGLPREVIEAMLIQFAQGQRGVLGSLRAALQKDDTEEARRLAHSLAGAAGNLSIHEMRRLAKTIELAIKFNQGDMETMLEELEREALKVFAGLDQLAARRSQGAPASDPPRTPTPARDAVGEGDRAAFEALAARLDDGDIEGIQAALALLRAICEATGRLELFQRLDRSIAAFDHVEAARLAREQAGPPANHHG